MRKGLALAVFALLAQPGTPAAQPAPGSAAQGAQPTPGSAPPATQAPPAQAQAAADSHGFTHPTRFGQRDGAALYAAICAGCHMPDGRGAVGAGRYPALAGNPKLEHGAYPVHVVVNGLRGMPGFATQLDDAQIAAVVDWVRTNLGNRFAEAPVRPEDVRAARP